MSDPWIKSAEEFFWTAEILNNMGRYAQALMLLCHALHLCKCKGNKAPLACCPKEYLENLFPKDNMTPEDLVSEQQVLDLMEEVRRCLSI